MTDLSRRAWLGGTLAAVGCPRPRATAATGPVRRIASQTVLSDEILWNLGPAVRDRVVAVSALVDDSRYSTVVDAWPAAIPRATATSEALLALAPDLVVLADFTAAETRRLVEDAGLRTVVLSGFDGFADYHRHVTTLAAAVDATEAGRALGRAFDDRLATVSRSAPRVRPSIVSWTEGNVAGAGTTFDDEARAAGFDNLAAARGRDGHQRISLEQLVAWDPEYLVVPCGPGEQAAVAAEIAGRPGLDATRAVRAGAVLAIESAHLYSSGAAMLDVVETLAAHHPEARGS